MEQVRARINAELAEWKHLPYSDFSADVHRNDEHTRLWWSKDFAELVHSAEADVLLVMHCCHAGAAAPAQSKGPTTRGTKELLAACAKDARTKGSGLAEAIAECLKENADIGEPVKVCELPYFTKGDKRLRAEPVFETLGGDNATSIRLQRLPYGGRYLRRGVPGRPPP